VGGRRRTCVSPPRTHKSETLTAWSRHGEGLAAAALTMRWVAGFLGSRRYPFLLVVWHWHCRSQAGQT